MHATPATPTSSIFELRIEIGNHGDGNYTVQRDHAFAGLMETAHTVADFYTRPWQIVRLLDGVVMAQSYSRFCKRPVLS